MPELNKLVEEKDRDFEILTVMAPGNAREKKEEEFVGMVCPTRLSISSCFVQSRRICIYGITRSVQSLTEVFIDSQGKIGHVQLGAISNEDAKKIILRESVEIKK